MKPLFQWAGGKTPMQKHYKPLYPVGFDTYVDPFVGSGGMLVQALEQNPAATCYINDSNKYLIGIYEAIKNDLDIFNKKVIELYDYFYSLPLTRTDASYHKTAYYKLREEYNYDYSKWSDTEQAAVLFFLIRNCYKGAWYTSKKTGRFGRGYGYNESRSIKNPCKSIILNLQEWHNKLQNIHIQSGDWKNCVGLSSLNAWVYLDPPYRGSLDHYQQEGGWTDANQTELLEFAVLETHRTTEVWLSNRDTGDGFFDDAIQQNSYVVDTHKFASKFSLKPTAGPHMECTELLLIKKPRVEDK